MKKVMVIGCPGSGKSTFSLALHQITALPLFHLDRLSWNADRTTVPREVFIKRLSNVINHDTWIIDGNYGSTIEMRLKSADTVFFLDYPLDVCLDGIEKRKGTKRPDMPWIESPDAQDEDFVRFIKSYGLESRPTVLALLEKYKEKNIITFKSRSDADKYLAQCCAAK